MHSEVPVATLSADQTDLSALVDDFHREGCILIPNVFSGDEVAALRAKTDAFAPQPDTGSSFVLRTCEKLDPLFLAMTTHAPILKVAQAVLGPDARFNAMNVIRNGRGHAIAHWHVDDVVEFPLPPGIPRFDARIRMPIFWMTVQVALSDIDSVEHGPTQYVPGSHYAGRAPDANAGLTFEGRGPVNVYCKAGDIYLTNHQCWHRGAPNQSERTRYIMQLQYAQGWADRRFKGFDFVPGPYVMRGG
jgi:ectoine hydroxylase-related dioxygenase (phytanoyl-CoA dioxygenase family)